MTFKIFFQASFLTSCLLIFSDGNSSYVSPEDEAIVERPKQGHYLSYNPYSEIEEGKIKVVTSIEAIRKEREELKISFMRYCDQSYYDKYQELLMAALSGEDDKRINKEALLLKQKMAPHLKNFGTYYIAHSRYGIEIPLQQLIEQDPAKLIAAVVKDTDLPENRIREILSDTYGWNT